MRCWPPLRPADVDAHPPQPTLLDLAGEAPPPLVVDLLLGDARELVERLLCALGGPHGGQFPDPSNAVARERSIARGDSSPLEPTEAGLAYFAGSRRVARSVPTTVVPANPPASTALR